MDLCTDMDVVIRLKIIKISKIRVIKSNIWDIMWKSGGENIDQEENPRRR